MRYLLTIAAFLCGVTSAFAAAPSTPCDKFAGMVDADGDKFCAFVGAATAATTGWSGKTDCDDTDKSVHPGATEVVADGIDQNCSGADLVLPVPDPAYKRYVTNAYAGKAPKAETFVAEYDRCKAATGRCTVNDVKGTFDITDSEKDAFVDVYVGTSKVLGRDGIREVVTLEEVSHLPGGSASGGYNGPSKETRKKEAIEAATPVVEAAVAKERDERVAEETREDAEDDVRDAAINKLANSLEDEAAARKAAIEAERVRAKVAEDTLGQRIDDVDSVLGSALSHGPLFEVGAVGGVFFRRGLNIYDEDGEFTGEEIRDSSLAGMGFELRAGVDARSYELAGFGQLSFGSDTQGSGPDIAALMGADVLVAVSDGASVGPWLAYFHTEDHETYIDVSVLENGVLGGLVMSGKVGSGAPRFVPFLRGGAGMGWYGARGGEDGEETVSWYGPVGTVQAGIRFGAGALQ